MKVPSPTPAVKAVGILLVLSANLGGILWLLDLHQREMLQVQSDVLAEQVAARLEDHVRTRLEVVEILGRQWEREGGLDRRTFDTQAALIQERFGGYQAINWADAQGVIRWVVPEAANREAMNRPVADDPLSAPALARARAQPGMHATGPVDLFQGGLGLVGYAAVRKDDTLDGYVSGVFHVEDLVATALGPGLVEGFAVRIEDDGRTIFSRGDVTAAPSHRLLASAHMDVAGRDWKVSVAPRSDTIAAVSGGHGFLFILGLAVAGLTAALFWVAGVRRQHLEGSLTERRRLEGELRQAQKMEAIGRLAGGVAHDFNNLLTVILGNVQIAERTARDPDLQMDLAAIRDAAKRGARLTSQLLAFSKRQTIGAEPIDLNEVVQEIESLLRRVLREDIELEVFISDDLWPVEIDRGQMEQVLVNLIVNAGDAMPQGGRLRVATTNVAGPADEVVMSVSDTGTGITPEVRARLFEPFFSTKRPGEGTGLGLSTVYGIVTGARGRLVVESEPGRGSEFKVILPRAARIELTPAPASTEMPGPAPGRVLLVEDDPTVLSVESDLLRALGYEVMEAANGREALSLLEGCERPPMDVLVSDAVMPELDGKSLAEALRMRWPELPILLTSGYVGEGFEEGWMRGLDVRFLPKPWTAERLAFEIEAARRSRGGPRGAADGAGSAAQP